MCLRDAFVQPCDVVGMTEVVSYDNHYIFVSLDAHVVKLTKQNDRMVMVFMKCVSACTSSETITAVSGFHLNIREFALVCFSDELVLD